MKRKGLTIVIGVLIGLSSSAALATTFDAIVAHYEPIRLALLGDSLDGVNEHGKAISAELRALEAEFSAEKSGAEGDAIAVVRDKLDEMIAAADAIAGAKTLDEARDGVYALTKPMVRWRQGVAESARPVVAYCPMYKRSWLQPSGDLEIGNPYGGMPRCGEIVEK
jgi:hypothetical protein